MSEEKSTPVQEKPKKKRHLWWLNLLLALAVFAGGVILGLKLPSMPMPYELVERYFPQLTAQSEAVTTAAVEPVKANPAELPAVSTPAPTEAPKPTETPAPTPVPTEAPKPEETPALPEKDKTATVAAVGGADAPTDIQEAPAEPAAIGLDAALKAALEHAKVRESEAEVFGVYKSVNADTLVYVVEFSAKNADYEYMINAATGEVEGWRRLRSFWAVEDADSALPADDDFAWYVTEDEADGQGQLNLKTTPAPEKNLTKK